MVEKRNLYRFVARKFEGKESLSKPGLGRKIILKLILKKWDVRICDEIF
jgi:hypothetical protein